ESAEEYELCRELGFDAYQGYFFALPELSRTPGTPTRELGTLVALAATDEDTSLEELENIVRRDAGLSHKLLRYANSAYVSPLRPIESLRHAVTMIGATSIRRWILLMALSGLLDAPTGREMDELVAELSFDDRLASALVRREGPEGAVLDATLAYERGAFDDAATHARPEVLADAYTQAL